MKKIIRYVDNERGIVQVTIADERWYLKSVEDEKTSIPQYKAVPSVTWIAGKYPKGIGFYKWLAEKSWDEAEALKQAAGGKGSKIHSAVADILAGYEVRIDSQYLNTNTNQMEELTLEECEAILSFKRWFDENKPESIVWEYTVFSDKHNYAGTIDYICKIGEEYWIVDFKTGQYVWPEYELQISAYRQALIDGFHDIPKLEGIKDFKIAVLQIGYQKNKAKFKWNELEDKFPLFLSAQTIWANEHAGENPTKREYPIVLSEGTKKD